MRKPVRITLGAAQASTLWWLCCGTEGATVDRILNRRCREIMAKLDKAGCDRGAEYARQAKR